MCNKLENKIYMAGTYTLQDTGEQVDIALERAMRSTSGLSLAATMGTPAAGYPLAVTTALADVNEQYKLYAAEQNRSRWALTITQASGGAFIEVAEAEPVTTSGGVSLEFVSKYNHYRYAVKLTVSDGEVTAVSARIIADPTLVKETVIDATALDQDKYYPVTIGLSVAVEAKLRLYDTIGHDTGKPSWGTHPNGFSCIAQWSDIGSGWGSVNASRIIDEYQFMYCRDDVPPMGSIGQMTESSNAYIYVRGGAKYQFQYSNAAGNPVLHAEDFTASGNTLKAGISAVRKEESLNKVANDAVKRIRMNATMGAESVNWPLSLNTTLASMQQYYTLFTSFPGQCRWALRVTDAQNAFIEEAELEPVAVSGGIELQFTSKFSKKRYAIVLTLSGGTVTAVKTEYRYRDDQQKYVDITRFYKTENQVMFNVTTGYWELNSLTDITDAQMSDIYEHGNFATAAMPLLERACSGTIIRTTIPRFNFSAYGNVSSGFRSFSNCNNIETIKLADNVIAINNLDGFGLYSSKLTSVLDNMIDQRTTLGTLGTISEAPLLTTFKIKSLRSHITLLIPLWNKESALFTIQNANPIYGAITITLLSDVYTRLMADPEIQTALEAQPLVALASA